MRALATLLLTALGVTAVAQPLPPELVLMINVPDVPASGGRFEFAPVPEVVFVRGFAETVQLGPFQVDPTNRWTAGDLTRSSGWLSAHSTQLVDAATGQPVPSATVSYDSSTAELKYAGAWSGDLTVRIEAAAARSVDFRIRVLTPTLVYGDNAAAINTQRGWNARVCESPMSFDTCRKTIGLPGGASDIAPFVLFIAPGRYAQNWYLNQERFGYILGHPTQRPTLLGYSISNRQIERFVVANVVMQDSNIGVAGDPSPDWPSTINVSRTYQCCETNVKSGLMNPNRRTPKPTTVEFWNSESKGMGHGGNTQHGTYIEMRPYSRYVVTNVRMMGSQGSSSIKTTMFDVQVRYTLFNVSREYDEPNKGQPSGYMLTHTMFDVVGASDFVAFGNHFRMWRQTTVGTASGYAGTLTGAIFVRRRREMQGSDRPSYPVESWNPPVGESLGSPPGGGWPMGAATFVNDAFWQDVHRYDITDPANPFSFKHFISFNTFELLPGSLPVKAVRDDGTHPIVAVAQFSDESIAKRTHPLWIERSVNWLYGNEYINFGDNEKIDLNHTQTPIEIEPGAKWPRTKPEEFPKAIEVTGELPSWFKL